MFKQAAAATLAVLLGISTAHAEPREQEWWTPRTEARVRDAATATFRIEGTLSLRKDTCRFSSTPDTIELGVTALVDGRRASVQLGDGRVAKGKFKRDGGINVAGKDRVGNGVKLVDRLVTGPLAPGSAAEAQLSFNYSNERVACRIVYVGSASVR